VCDPRKSHLPRSEPPSSRREAANGLSVTLMFHILVTETAAGKMSADFFESAREGKDAFRKVKDGSAASLFELRRSQAVKRRNIPPVHKDAKNSLAKMSDSQLRAEAKKRKLAIAGNPQARPADLINEIQQHELTKRLNHRQPFQAVATPPIPANQVPKEEK
jgi:hypothetical protein